MVAAKDEVDNSSMGEVGRCLELCWGVTWSIACKYVVMPVIMAATE